MARDITGVTKTRKINLREHEALSRQNRRSPAFQILRGWNVGLIQALDPAKPSLSIGRDRKASFRINHDSVSRLHAEVTFCEGRVQLRDNGSTNGTRVNGQRIDEATLRPGDKIYIGDILLRFDLMDEADIAFASDLRAKALSAQRDALTGLLSKSYFLEQLPSIIDYYRRRDRQLVMVVIDLDHFKKVNDTYGHQAGDLVLAETAGVILSGIREIDLAIRYGGEELLLLLADITKEVAVSVAERLRKEVSEHRFAHKDQVIPVTISLGMAVLHDTDTLETLFQRADQALYSSKRYGRNRLTVV
ncbi:MAG: hypothetical protein A2284_18535 [Deltaproteobacteria bacterium RIFOXYA12_FULL_61_11]|nr:MAG: hypothetical protein A2284_18535 [Deltaproteobacteria bacterium RIFOXYA12_FULL_61_11]